MSNAIYIASKKPMNKTAKNSPKLLRERISKAAYFLSEERGCDGDEVKNWLDAEISILRT
jgi:hypothetical protein